MVSRPRGRGGQSGFVSGSPVTWMRSGCGLAPSRERDCWSSGCSWRRLLFMDRLSEIEKSASDQRGLFWTEQETFPTLVGVRIAINAD